LGSSSAFVDCVQFFFGAAAPRPTPPPAKRRRRRAPTPGKRRRARAGDPPAGPTHLLGHALVGRGPQLRQHHGTELFLAAPRLHAGRNVAEHAQGLCRVGAHRRLACYRNSNGVLLKRGTRARGRAGRWGFGRQGSTEETARASGAARARSRAANGPRAGGLGGGGGRAARGRAAGRGVGLCPGCTTVKPRSNRGQTAVKWGKQSPHPPDSMSASAFCRTTSATSATFC
jgi:hypothetical protein